MWPALTAWKATLYLVGVLCVASLCGCMGPGLHYIAQAAAGQEKLNGHGVDIDEVVAKGYLDKRTRELLAEVPRIKAFGERHGLRPTRSYQRYLWLNRPAVTWIVSACDPLRFQPKAWTFPVIGSVTYAGWFDRKEAEDYARELAAMGWDVDVRGAQGYSTLGWFEDPVLSTMLRGGDAALGDLADTVLHESLHATFYVPNQSKLNESMASFVGDTLAPQFLDESHGALQKARYLDTERLRLEQSAKMKAAYDALEKLYSSSIPDAAKIVEKTRIFTTLRADLHASRPLTNATLMEFKTYGSGRREMQTLLDRCDGSFPRMLRSLERVRTIAKEAAPHSDPALLLKPLLSGNCEAI